MRQILVVEDDDNDLDLLKRALGETASKTICCSTGRCAMEIFDPGRFRAVLLNLKLPDVDGIELVRYFRNKSSETLIVVITGAEDPRHRAQAIEAGASGFFTKPYTSEDYLMLLTQLDAQGAAYKRGKKINHWRTTSWGALAAAGTCLFGCGIVLAQLDKLPKHLGTIVVSVGVGIQAAGIFGAAMSGADKKSIDEHMRPVHDWGEKK